MDLETLRQTHPKLVEEYGILLLQAEITQGKIQECKRNIAQVMNNPKKEKKDVKAQSNN